MSFISFHFSFGGIQSRHNMARRRVQYPNDDDDERGTTDGCIFSSANFPCRRAVYDIMLSWCSVIPLGGWMPAYEAVFKRGEIQ